MSRTRLAIVLAVVGTTLAATTTVAGAATYTVGGKPTDRGGACVPSSGECSLRQLVEYEDALPATHSPADTIVVPSGKYQLTKGQLVITQSLAIAGAGARTTSVVHAGESPERVFDVKVPGEAAPPTVIISGLEISGGTAGESNGYFGGDVYNAANLTLEEDWITGGDASSGGGISNDTGTLRVARSLVSENQASTGGGDSGGIQNHGSAQCNGNACLPGKKAVLTVEDSTVAFNEARLGAGIFSWSDASAGHEDGNEVFVIDSTIADNVVKEESDAPPRGPGAGLLVSDGTINVAGSILGSDYEINDEGEYVPTNCSTLEAGTIKSLGYNLENGTECGFGSRGDVQNADPDFSSYEPQENGGDTDTLAPEPWSRVVDAIPTSFKYCDGSDQRVIPRPQGAGCDMGAVELVPYTIEATEGKAFSGKLPGGRCDVGTTQISWGDGQKSPGKVNDSEEISGEHTYAEDGTYNGSVTYECIEDNVSTYKIPFQAKVADAPLSVTAAPPLSATPGVQFTGTVATFTDANPDGKLSQYTADIEWGDGSVTAGTIGAAGKGFAVTGTHTYTAAGVYTATITIDDVGGAKASATDSVSVTGPPIVSNVSVTSVTETTATIGFTIDPDGGETSYVIDYGHTTSYGTSTTPVNIGANPGPQQLTRTLTGLEPGSAYHFDVVATNSQAAEGVISGDQPFTTAPVLGSGVLGAKIASSGTGGGPGKPLPPPVLGKTVNIELVSGKVFISLPTTGQMSLAAPLETALASISKGLHFIPLTEARQIPVGSTLETTAGVARITTATATLGKTQSGEFGAGIFELLQNRKQKGLTDLDILDSRSAKQVCASVGKKAQAASRHLSSKTLGRLNSSAHGSFSTHGQYSASTVRGTVWSVTNQCDGTLTKVTRGVVSVRDFRTRKTITLFAGQHYLAKAPGS